MKHREGDAPPEKDPGEQTRTAMMIELLDSDLADEEIIRRVRAVLAADDVERIVHSTLAREIDKERNNRARAMMRGPIPGRRKLPVRDNTARDEFIDQALAHDIEREPGDRLSRRADFLKESFKIRGVGAVKWGDATAAHHQMRLEQLKALSGGIFETATLHVRALSEIEAAGVATLNEVAALRHANEKAIEPPDEAAA